MYFVTTRTSQHTDGSKFQVLAVTEKRDVARRQASPDRLDGTVRNQAELDKLIQAGRVDMTTMPGYVAPEPIVVAPAKPSFIDIAQAVHKTAKTSSTIGKKEKFLKRVITSPEVIEAATRFATDSVIGASKVNVVRLLTAWAAADGTRLQRRDVFAVIRKFSSLDDLADATISTQFQLVRSGKLAEKQAAAE